MFSRGRSGGRRMGVAKVAASTSASRRAPISFAPTNIACTASLRGHPPRIGTLYIETPREFSERRIARGRAGRNVERDLARRHLLHLSRDGGQDAGAGLRATNHRPCRRFDFPDGTSHASELHALTQRDTVGGRSEAGGRAKSALRSSVERGRRRIQDHPTSPDSRARAPHRAREQGDAGSGYPEPHATGHAR